MLGCVHSPVEHDSVGCAAASHQCREYAVKESTNDDSYVALLIQRSMLSTGCRSKFKLKPFRRDRARDKRDSGRRSRYYGERMQ
jgi:hypothetical protein